MTEQMKAADEMLNAGLIPTQWTIHPYGSSSEWDEAIALLAAKYPSVLRECAQMFLNFAAPDAPCFFSSKGASWVDLPK